MPNKEFLEEYAMSKPIKIAKAKLSLATTSAASALKSSAEAIHRRGAARGMGGGTIVEMKNECVTVLKGLEVNAAQELSWVLDHTILANPTTVDRCNTIAHSAVNVLFNDCVSVLRKTVTVCGGNERQLAVTEHDLHTQREQSLMSVSLALDSRYSELNFRRFRSILGFIQRFAQLLLRHGT